MLDTQKCPWKQHTSYKTLPRTGYIVLMNDKPLAAGFLRRVEGGYGQLDTFATNPYLGSKLRNEAINLIVDQLMEEAKRLKLHGLLAFTHDKGILSRASHRGFNATGETLLVLKI